MAAADSSDELPVVMRRRWSGGRRKDAQRIWPCRTYRARCGFVAWHACPEGGGVAVIRLETEEDEGDGADGWDPRVSEGERGKREKLTGGARLSARERES